MDQFLSYIVSLQGVWIYWAMFLGMFIDANVTVLVTSLLVGLNGLNIKFIFLAIISGALLEQFLWYFLGLRLGKRQLVATWANRLVGKYDSHLQNKTLHTIMVSKFAFGVHRAVLVRCGMLGVPFQKLLRSLLPATLIWLAVIGGLGYSFGSSYKLIREYMQFGGLLLLLVIIAFLIVQYFLSRNLRKSL